ncbi:hypothetical protein HYP06_gp075 [Vibrio phage vB_VspP_pVa5]|uniref:Lipoprotein n=1 Tax=Vibrio phage vB_VspP_pVa5 TaxID=1913109 RepID=A0A1J0GV46_9CAUD|nr:hypothetical protein HYP06_gp075 [Vibrio phage vB_VspP_pVa5]APC46055.1 hypothetical protein vBVspPpVa5_0098 [Vibrio phage vB_VspP_pVa5]
MKYLIAMVMSLALIGCGGGGGGSSTPSTPSDDVVVTPVEHCSVNNTYHEYLGTRTYVFEVNECNGLVSLDIRATTGLIDSVKYSDSTTVVYSQGSGENSLAAGDVYSFKWDVDAENQVKYQWDENLQCYQGSDGGILCDGDSTLDNIKTYYEYSLVKYEFKQAIKEATRIK